ncbi:GAF domain-containing protein [Mycobacterium sp. CBMA247]|nr:GAF domain-containing protein [Mycolicibacterium sp. CBMA 329]MUL87453.1 GAF domain-containing protein [Mycolicibacterium sp. CBMA 331]MUL99682.1 GAF domain-containing protein [Mycolicibacterium sp. CBMA 334]MUM28267.1 GAF domain-containing protein [Mycolicibacterium sp. CBMA 295]MUM37750.1 GAF domain-containing protein [Mycolicibacterium sp. CBMA 247]MUM43518.1 GAF domain-containing protein [Mycolicibacterium sp. CBMA 294]
MLLRPTAPPPAVGIAVAAVFIIAETLVVTQLRRVAPENSFGAVFLLGVLVVSAGWGMRLAVATSLVSAVVYVHFHMETHGALLPIHTRDVAAISIFVPVALLTNVLVGQARLRAADAAALAEQQAALRRVATLVARGSHPDEVFPVAVAELAGGLGMDHVGLLLYQDDGTAVVLASGDPRGEAKLAIGERMPLESGSLVTRIAETAQPARVEDYARETGATASRIRGIGIRSAVGAPITVDGQVRGLLVVGSARPHAFDPGTEARVGDFADLVATAIANSETRAALTASRARIVTAADQARRQFERDLHDGAQQRVVSLSLALRATQASIPSEQTELVDQLDRLVTGLSALSTELQELSRGMHPAVLSRSGLGAAIRSLARRSPIPVDIDVDLSGPIPESVGVAAYYVLAEALTNAAKHSGATAVEVAATVTDHTLHLSVHDDGVGGAVTGAGSGLIGLRDRAEALSGQLSVASPPGAGTTIRASIPLNCG